MSNIDSNNDDAGEQADDVETIALARDMGWKPEAEWKGAPPRGGFTTAGEYVKRGEKILPIVNARAKKAEDEVKALRAELDTTRSEQRATIARIEKMSTVALAQQRDQIESKYAERIEKAAELGDTAGVKQARKDEKEALKAIDDKLEPTADEKKAAATEQSKMPRAVQETVDAWEAENPWYKHGGKGMSAFAMATHLELQETKPGLSLAENLAEVTKEVRRRYPEKFATADDDDPADDDEPVPRRGSRVEGSSRQGGDGGSRFSKLPSDAKKQADKFIKEDGLFLQKGETVEKNLAAARERYAVQYFEDQAS